MKVGYVGLGALGRELALRFLPDHELHVWDLNPAACEPLRARGAVVDETPAALGRACDVILICVPRSSDVEDLLFGSGGLATALTPGKLVIDQTSGLPTETAKFAERLRAQGVSMLDSAVSANPNFVHRGEATLMLSGPQADVERAVPMLQAITQTIRHCGSRVGDGQAIKLINNAIFGVIRLATLEIVGLARKVGFSYEEIEAVLSRGETRGHSTMQMIPALAKGEASSNFALALMLKDLNQAVDFGLAYQVPLPLSGLTRGLFQVGLNMNGKQATLEDMLGFIETISGFKLSEPGPTAETPDGELLPALEKALGVICRLATLECCMAGARFGLEWQVLANVLGASSGSSGAGTEALVAIVEGHSSAPYPFVPYLDALESTIAAGVRAGIPLIIPSAALNILASFGAYGDGLPADLSEIAAIQAQRAGVSLAIV